MYAGVEVFGHRMAVMVAWLFGNTFPVGVVWLGHAKHQSLETIVLLSTASTHAAARYQRCRPSLTPGQSRFVKKLITTIRVSVSSIVAFIT